MVTVSEQKLDKILNAIAMLTEKVDKLDFKYEAIEVCLDNIESNFNYKIKEIENHLKEKAEKNEVEQIRNDLSWIKPRPARGGFRGYIVPGLRGAGRVPVSALSFGIAP